MACHMVIDTETTTMGNWVANSRKPMPHERVHAWLACGINTEDTSDHVAANDIGGLLEWLFSHDCDGYLWAHNSEFDGRFIWDWCLTNGWVTDPGVTRDDRVIVGEAGDCTLYDRGHAWSLVDSMALLPGSLRAIGAALGDVPKGETPLVEEGHSIEEYTHEVDDPSGQELFRAGEPWTQDQAAAYCLRDCEIVRRAITTSVHGMPSAVTLCENGVTTIAKASSWAMLDWKGMRALGRQDYAPRQVPSRPKPPKRRWLFDHWEDGVAVWSREGARLKWRRPPHVAYEVPDRYEVTLQTRTVVMDRGRDAKRWRKVTAMFADAARGAYKGGLCMKARDSCGAGIGLDVNSLYPWVYSTMPLPGAPKAMHMFPPRPFEDGDAQGFKVIEMSLLRAHVRPGWVPAIKPRTDDPNRAYDKFGRDVRATYEEELDLGHCWVTAPEVAYLRDAYKVLEADVFRVWEWERDQRLEELLRSHCERWMGVKRTSSGFERYYAKLMLNSAYGRLGMYEREVTAHTGWHVGEGGLTADLVKRRSGSDLVPVIAAAYVTAYGRCYLARSIHSCFDRFCYCDTDSMILEGCDVPEGLHVDDSDLGAWKVDKHFASGQFLAPKTYGLLTENGWHTTCAGVVMQVPEESFAAGQTVVDKRACAVPGGVAVCGWEMVVGGS